MPLKYLYGTDLDDASTCRSSPGIHERCQPLRKLKTGEPSSQCRVRVFARRGLMCSCQRVGGPTLWWWIPQARRMSPLRACPTLIFLQARRCTVGALSQSCPPFARSCCRLGLFTAQGGLRESLKSPGHGPGGTAACVLRSGPPRESEAKGGRAWPRELRRAPEATSSRRSSPFRMEPGKRCRRWELQQLQRLPPCFA